MSHHEEESNKPIRDLLNCYESLENYISKFSIVQESIMINTKQTLTISALSS